MTDRNGFGPGGLLQLPTPIDVVAREHAEPVLQAAADELAVLHLELAEVDDELAAAREHARAIGADPSVLASARTRLDELVATVVAEAELHAASITAQATQAGAALLQRAEAHAHLLRTGQVLSPEPPPTTAAPAVAPLGYAPVAAMAPAMPMVPPGWALVPQAVAPEEQWDEPEPQPLAPTPYAKTVGLLQVVTWSVLVAVVLIVLLAWFA